MFKLDRLFQVFFFIGLGFLLISIGIITAHYRMAPATLFQWAFSLSDGPRHKVQKQMANPKLSDARTKSMAIEKAYPGYTLITKDDTQIALIDMEGKAVHSWRLPFTKVWSPSIREGDNFTKPPVFGYAQIMQNGDVIALYHTDDRKSLIYGLGLVRMDRQAKLIWQYGANVHDDFYVAADGKIYTLLQNLTRGLPLPDVNYSKPPVMTDSIAILSPDGKEEAQIDVLQAFLGTPFEQYLYSLGNGMRYTLANAVMPLEKDLADKFPMFKTGDILITVANIDTIAVIRPDTGKVIWASRNMWRRPYHARFLDNGNIMLYDTRGYYDGTRITKPRVLQINPATLGVSWSYVQKDKNEDTGKMTGMQQMLPNGNVLITQEDAGQIVEVSPDKQVVWQYNYPNDINSAQRISYDFLDKNFWVGAK